MEMARALCACALRHTPVHTHMGARSFFSFSFLLVVLACIPQALGRTSVSLPLMKPLPDTSLTTLPGSTDLWSFSVFLDIFLKGHFKFSTVHGALSKGRLDLSCLPALYLFVPNKCIPVKFSLQVSQSLLNTLWLLYL